VIFRQQVDVNPLHLKGMKRVDAIKQVQ